MKHIFISILLLANFYCISQDGSCFQEVKASDFNLNICLIDKMCYVNSTDPNKLIIGNWDTETKIAVSKKVYKSKKH